MLSFFNLYLQFFHAETLKLPPSTTLKHKIQRETSNTNHLKKIAKQICFHAVSDKCLGRFLIATFQVDRIKNSPINESQFQSLFLTAILNFEG